MLRVVNALAAASIAFFVSDQPISGITPGSSLVAGSDSESRRVVFLHEVMMRERRTRNDNLVLLHVVNALAAASIASFVSDQPISGIIPGSSLVARSDSESRRVIFLHEVMMRERRTRNDNLVAGLCAQPFPIDKRLKSNQT